MTGGNHIASLVVGRLTAVGAAPRAASGRKLRRAVGAGRSMAVSLGCTSRSRYAPSLRS
jgi:hypothetical protein